MLRPFFSFFGSKWRAAKRYAPPRYDTIVEPFAGSAGYSLRNPSKNVILNDVDPKVFGTWDYLIHASEDEILGLPVVDGTWETVDDLTYIPQEARWLIGWWLNKGSTQPAKSPSKWHREATVLGENFWGEGMKNRIASQLKYIRHWKILNKSYTDLDVSHECTWFVDPPYEVAGKYRHRDIDYTQLSKWCMNDLKGQVTVCENVGAEWLPFVAFADIKAMSGKNRTGVSKESVWTNY